MMHDPLEHEPLPQLRTMAGKQPSAAVRRRILEGARERTLSRQNHPLRRLFVGAALAGAAAAALVITVPLFGSPTGTSDRPSQPMAGVTAATLDAVASVGDYSIGPHRVQIDADSRLRFLGVDPRAVRLDLQEGRATFSVDKLGGGDTFEVRTDQVLVQVVGTRFTVVSSGECSEVIVEEGRVRVLSPSEEPNVLGAGQSGRFCEPNQRKGVPGYDPLAQGESLIRDALVLVSQGRDLDRAAHLLGRYRAEYPDGPFVEEALFHLALVKARLGFADEARHLAQTFERTFPASPRADKLHRMIAAPTE